MNSQQDALKALARRAGILDEYAQQGERGVKHTSDQTRRALLAAMGVDASSDSAAENSLRYLLEMDEQRILQPVRVVRGASKERTHEITAHIPGASDDPGNARVHIDWTVVHIEHGSRERQFQGRSVSDKKGDFRIELPEPPAAGYHDVHLEFQLRGEARLAAQRLIVSPSTCPPVEHFLQGRRAFGLSANLYTVPGETNWGVGDSGDLARLAGWCGKAGGDFVGINPLHAIRNSAGDISPYRPVSRVFRNPLYLDVSQVPELTSCTAARALANSLESQGRLDALRAERRLDYGAVWKCKREILELLFECFLELHLRQGSARATDYGSYLERQGLELVRFATFMSIEEVLQASGVPSRGWQNWPVALRDPQSSAVQAFRRTNQLKIEFHCWLQYELDRQLAAVARAAREAGMRLGLYQDLAIGCAPDGSDVWSNQDLFARGVSLGAPPDEYSESGQNWGLPPIDPFRLRETGYAYWTTLVRSALQHSGALRLDHILGVVRQFWIPEGAPASEGAYVTYPTRDLLGVLALEATRAGAVIIGEDLGTVPPEVPEILADWRILGTRVLYFEKDSQGDFRGVHEYSPDSLTVADTHDQIPLAGFLTSRDIDIRLQTGLTDAESAVEARESREREKRSLVEFVRASGVELAPDADDDALRHAVLESLCRSPAALVAITLEDLAGETEPVNVPGIGDDGFPNWSRRLSLTIEQMRASQEVRRVLRACREARLL